MMKYACAVLQVSPHNSNDGVTHLSGSVEGSTVIRGKPQGRVEENRQPLGTLPTQGQQVHIP